MGYSSSRSARTAQRIAAMLAAVLLLVLLAAPLERSLAEESSPTPQLPILLLNGAIYSGQYDAGALPASFRVEGYPEDVRTLYLKDLTLIGCTFQEDVVFENLVKCIEQGEIRPLVAKTYPLENIIKAQKDFLEKKYTGKLVLVPKE